MVHAVLLLLGVRSLAAYVLLWFFFHAGSRLAPCAMFWFCGDATLRACRACLPRTIPYRAMCYVPVRLATMPTSTRSPCDAAFYGLPLVGVAVLANAPYPLLPQLLHICLLASSSFAVTLPSYTGRVHLPRRQLCFRSPL